MLTIDWPVSADDPAQQVQVTVSASTACGCTRTSILALHCQLMQYDAACLSEFANAAATSCNGRCLWHFVVLPGVTFLVVCLQVRSFGVQLLPGVIYTCKVTVHLTPVPLDLDCCLAPRCDCIEGNFVFKRPVHRAQYNGSYPRHTIVVVGI